MYGNSSSKHVYLFLRYFLCVAKKKTWYSAVRNFQLTSDLTVITNGTLELEV
jgi:hypothetical protein